MKNDIKARYVCFCFIFIKCITSTIDKIFIWIFHVINYQWIIKEFFKYRKIKISPKFYTYIYESYMYKIRCIRISTWISTWF